MPEKPHSSLQRWCTRRKPRNLREIFSNFGYRECCPTEWLGRKESNLRMPESKSGALPLGYAPTCCNIDCFSPPITHRVSLLPNLLPRGAAAYSRPEAVVGPVGEFMVRRSAALDLLSKA